MLQEGTLSSVAFFFVYLRNSLPYVLNAFYFDSMITDVIHGTSKGDVHFYSKIVTKTN